MLRSSMCRASVLWVGGVISSLCLGGPPPAHAGSYNFVTIDLPGALGTDIYGINNNGLISGLGFNSSFQSTGFLYNNGILTPYTAPLPGGGSAIDTEFYQVNNAGQVAVSYYGADSIYHAAVYNSGTATWTYLPDIQGAAQNLAGGINNHGLVVGDSFTNSSFSGGVGWSWNGSQYTMFSAPGADPSLTPGGTATYSVNDAGQIVGYAIDSNGIYHGYLKTGSSFTTLDVPGAAQFGGTSANGINNEGVVTGYYYSDSSGDFSGFLWQNNNFLTLDFPGAVSTAITSINDQGDLTGYYIDSNGNFNGFVAYSVPEPSTLTLLCIGLAGAVGCMCRRRGGVSSPARAKGNP
jgi:PEP-CTERM motif